MFDGETEHERKTEAVVTGESAGKKRTEKKLEALWPAHGACCLLRGRLHPCAVHVWGGGGGLCGREALLHGDIS